MSEHIAPFNTSPVKAKFLLPSHSMGCSSVFYPSRVKRWRQKHEKRRTRALRVRVGAFRRTNRGTGHTAVNAVAAPTDFRGNEWQGSTKRRHLIFGVMRFRKEENRWTNCTFECSLTTVFISEKSKVRWCKENIIVLLIGYNFFFHRNNIPDKVHNWV